MRLGLRVAGALILLLGVGIWLSPRFMHPPPLCYVSRYMIKQMQARQFCDLSTDKLISREKEVVSDRRLFGKEIKRMEAEFERNKMELTRVQRLRRESVAIAEPEQLTQLRRYDLLKELEQDQLEEEQFWRRAGIATWPLYTMLSGFFLLILSVLPVPGANRHKLAPLKGSIRRVREEKELVASSYASVAEHGGATYEEAVAMLAQDELRICTYCGGDLRIDNLGEVIEVRYFKKRPADVSVEHRQYLGTRFHPQPVDSRKCIRCGHTVRR